MGYRSDVAAMFYVEHEDQLPLLQLFVEENFPFDHFGDGQMKHIDSDYVYGYEFRAGYVKWYDAYPDVQAFGKFVDKFAELADEVITGGGGFYRNWAYEYIRLGEDEDDMERGCSQQSYGLLSITRGIHINYGET